MNNDKIIDTVTNKIISKIDSTFNTLQKIRFVYLELGKYLEKNTDFFLSDKLNKMSLSAEEINDIYYKDKINVAFRNGQERYQIICKSAALFLKHIFDKLGIVSDLFHTNGEVDSILHWFLVVKGDNEEQYFLTLAADLPFIKNNFPTCHFASHINYFDEFGNPRYFVPENCKFNTKKVSYKNEDGKVITGLEINHTVLTNSEEKEQFLKDLDKSIGYEKLYDSSLIDDKGLRELFYVQMEQNSMVFNIYRKCFNIEKDSFKNTFDVTESEVDNFKKELENYFQKFFKKNLGINSADAFKEYLIDFLKEEVKIDSSLSYREIEEKYRSEIRKINKKVKSDYIIIIQSIVALGNKFDNFISLRKECNLLEKNIQKCLNEKDDFVYTLQKQRLVKEEALVKAKNSISITKLSPLMNTLAFCLIKNDIIFSKKEYVPLEYIVNKFKLMFPLIFDCNYMNYETLPYNSFSIQNYSEQIVIVKQMLHKIFSELSENNCKDMEDYDIHYSPVENRIQTYPLKDKETGEYCIGFRFGAKSTENVVQYIYIPSKNLLRLRNPIKDKNKYWIVSERFNKQLQKIEDIEESNLERKK